LTNVYSTGTISGTQNVGGLVGNNIGTISRSYSTASVTATGSSVGGLVGQQVGTISQSYAGGPVSGLSSVGGLAGFSLSGAMISDAYATG
ncbi:GLUG motif-containing protein, partial [Acinetobacter baumannii]